MGVVVQLREGVVPATGEVVYWDGEGWATKAVRQTPYRYHTQTMVQVVMNQYQSPDYVAGSAGWAFKPDGSLEANNITARGTIYSEAGQIGGWTIGPTTLYNGSDIVLDAGSKTLSVGGSAWESQGIQLQYNAGTPRAYIGNGSDKYLRWDGTVLQINGSVVTGIQAGSELGIQGWQFDGVFSAVDADTVQWTAGTLRFLNGDTYSIQAGSTGNMTPDTRYYIYWDKGWGGTLFGATTTASQAVGANKVLVAIAKAGTHEATWQVFGGSGGLGITGPDIEANSITAAEIAANTITANEIAANTITAGEIVAGTITSTEIAANTITAGNIAAGTITATEIATGTITATRLSMGVADDLFSQADGLLLLGPHCEITTTSWKTARRQVATISGAFRQVQGYWQATRAVPVYSQATNLIVNPSFEVNVTDGWTTLVGFTAAQSTAESVPGAASCKLTRASVAGGDLFGSAYITVSASASYTASAYIKKTIATGTGTLYIHWYDSGNGYISSSSKALDSGTHDWKRYTITATSPATAAKARVYFQYNGLTVGTQLEMYLDGVQFEAGAAATAYFDGTFGQGFSWSGTAHNSTSTCARTEINLDGYAGLVSENSTLSFRLVVQMPYDADATWNLAYPYFFMAYYDADEWIRLAYETSTDTWIFWTRSGAAAQIVARSSVQTFKAGDWLDIVGTLDYSGDILLYINGVEDGSNSIAAISAPRASQLNIGGDVSGGAQSGAAIAEFVLFDRVLTGNEVAALYALRKPSLDLNPMDGQGIYMLDGRFRLASSATGNRIEITPEEVAGYNSSGTKQFYLRASDGAALAAGGKLLMDATGLQIYASTTMQDFSSIRFRYDYSGTVYNTCRIVPQYDSGGSNDALLWLLAERGSGAPWDAAEVLAVAHDYVTSADARLIVTTDNWARVYASGDFLVGGGLTVGHTAVNPDDGDLLVYRGAAVGSLSVNPGDGELYVDDKLFINETSCADLTYGICVNQGGYSNAVFSAKSSLMSHGMTDVAESDTFGTLGKAVADYGGLKIIGLTEYEEALTLIGDASSDNTIKASTAIGAINIQANKRSGTNVSAMGTDANLVTIRNYASTRFIFDAEGSAHAEVEWTTFQDHDDVGILADLEAELHEWKRGKGQKIRRQQLAELGLVRFHENGDGERGAMLNTTRLLMLLTGAMRQTDARVREPA